MTVTELLAWQFPASINKLVRVAHDKKQKIVLATGVFDLLHEEHEKFLRSAKAAGDVLLIGLESDVRVRSVKGEGRPVNGEGVRLENLEKLHIADGVFILPEQFSTPKDHQALIEMIRPAVLAVSSHTAHLDKKAAVMKVVGGEVRVVHEHNPEVSTTILLSKRRNSS